MRKILLTFLTVALLSNMNFAQNFTQHIIDDNTTAPDFHNELYEIASGDLDGVGGIDIVVASYDYFAAPAQDYIKWYSNDGYGNFTIEATISSTIEWVDGLIVVDIDGMYGHDIVATSANQNKLVYFLSDGVGGFGIETTVDGAINGPGEVIAADLNEDGNMDLITVSYGNERTQWYLGDGAGGFTPQTHIHDGIFDGDDGPYFVKTGDLDGDTDIDVVVGYVDSQSIVIYYNQFFGSGTVSWIKDTVPVDTGGSYLFEIGIGDVNNDGNMNVVKVDFTSGDVAWYSKIVNGASTENIICDDTIINNPASVLIADIDNDLLNDVIVTDGGVVDDALIWFKGASGASPSSTPTTIVNNNHIMYDIVVGNFDPNYDDDDIDIVSIGNASDTVDWWESDLDTTLSNEESTIDAINIYPNPTTDILNFKELSAGNHSISITDVLGKNIMKTTINSNDGLNVSQLNNGIYIIKFEDSNTTFKFIKK